MLRTELAKKGLEAFAISQSLSEEVLCLSGGPEWNNVSRKSPIDRMVPGIIPYIRLSSNAPKTQGVFKITCRERYKCTVSKLKSFALVVLVFRYVNHRHTTQAWQIATVRNLEHTILVRFLSYATSCVVKLYEHAGDNN